MFEIGERIRKKRKQRDMTLDDVCKKVGIARNTLSQYETGVITNFSLSKVESIARALNTSPGYLMGWEDDPDETDAGISPDAEINEALEFFANRPEGKMLFSVTKDATTEEILQAVKIIEALKK